MRPLLQGWLWRSRTGCSAPSSWAWTSPRRTGASRASPRRRAPSASSRSPLTQTTATRLEHLEAVASLDPPRPHVVESFLQLHLPCRSDGRRVLFGLVLQAEEQAAGHFSAFLCAQLERATQHVILLNHKLTTSCELRRGCRRSRAARRRPACPSAGPSPP